MTGPMMIISQVQAAEQVVARTLQDMGAVAQKLQANADLSTVAMKAPAGGITANNFTAQSGAAKALAETLGDLQRDLATTRQTLMAGSDQATAAANKVQAPGGGDGAVTAGMA